MVGFYIGMIDSGGAARVIVNLANMFALNGIEVALIVNYRGQHEYSLDSRINIITLDDRSYICFIDRNYHRLLGLRRIIKELGIINLICFMYENDVRAYIATRHIKCDLLISIRNDPSVVFRGKHIKRIIFKYICKQSEKIVCQTEEQKKWVGKTKGSLKIIRNLVDPEFFKIAREHNNFKDIVCIGRFTKQKNHLMLLRAFNRIKNEVRSNLHLYGEGELESEYRKYIENNNLENRVFIEGQVNDIPKVLSTAKIFVLTSIYEGTPNTLIEAIVAGVPLITTNFLGGGISSILGKNLNKWTIDIDDEWSLGQKIIELEKMDENEYNMLSAQIRKLSNFYNPEVIFEKWKSFVYCS